MNEVEWFGQPTIDWWGGPADYEEDYEEDSESYSE